MDRTGEGVFGVANDLRQGNLGRTVHNRGRWSALHRPMADCLWLRRIRNCQTKIGLGSDSNIHFTYRTSD